MKVLQVISSLGTGGAEKFVTQLVPALRSLSVDAHLLVLYRRRTLFHDERQAAGGLTVPPADADALAVILWRLAHDRTERSQLAARGRAIAREYGIRRCAEKYRNLYHQLLGERLYRTDPPAPAAVN